MFALKHFIFVAALITLKETRGFIDLSQIEDNYILRTESIVRNIANKIFTSLKLKRIRDKPIAKHYSLIHHYFVSLTLEDYANLKQIANLSRVDTVNHNNKADNLINELNSVLNTDFNTSNSNDSKENAFAAYNYTDHISRYIDSRLKELEFLKFYSADSPKLDINKDILAVLNNEAQALNGSIKIEGIFENPSDNFTDGEDVFWKPDPRYSGRRIYHGKRTKIKYFPFMASIEVFQKFTCGGSIIGEDVIITAASCLQLAWNNRFYRENPDFLSVRVGSNYYNGGGELIPVLELFFHPSYNPKTLSSNLALIRLHRKIKMKNKKKSKVKFVEFDKRDTPLPMNVEGITIVGWGALTIKNTVMNPWENKISFAKLDVYSLQECQDIYTKEYVTATNFCAGFISKGIGACNKDVGGPGLVAGVLTGIISFGSPACGTPNSPTVFTKVGYYANWIEEVLEKIKNSPYVKHQTTLLTTPYHPYYTASTTRLRTSSMHIRPIGNDSFFGPVNLEPTTPIPHQTAPPNMFNEFLKTMFDSKEIAEYLDLDAQDKETNLKNAQIIEERKEQIEDNFPQIHPFTPIDSNTHATPSILRNKPKRNQPKTRPKQEDIDNYKPKKKKTQVHITKLDYDKRFSKDPFNYLSEIPPHLANKYTGIGSASAETTDRFYRYPVTAKTKKYTKEKSSKSKGKIEPRSKYKKNKSNEIRFKSNKEKKERDKYSEQSDDSDSTVEDEEEEEEEKSDSLQISNEKNSGDAKKDNHDKDGNVNFDFSDNDNEGIKVFDNNDMVDTEEFEIDIGNDDVKNSADKTIDELFNDNILGDKFTDDGDYENNQAGEEIEDYDGIGDIPFNENDIDLDKEETLEDYKEDLMLPEDLADLTFRNDKNSTFGALSEKLIFDILSDFIAAQTQNITTDDL